MQILEHENQWLRLALAQQQAADGVQRSLAPLPWIEGLPLIILDRHIKEGQQRGQSRLERPVQREELAGHLLSDLTMGLAIAHLEVALEETDDGQIAGCPAVRYRARL